MKVVNFGSLNLDHVYKVRHFVQAGETISSLGYDIFCGGKGLNQSIAAARAGAAVYHAGRLGAGGEALREMLQSAGVRLDYLKPTGVPSGHAIIQVDEKGQNCIIIHGGANHEVSEGYVDEVAAALAPGDCVMLQNEVSNVAHIIQKAHAMGAKVVLNPSPITPELLQYPLELVDLFILNEIEAQQLCGAQSEDFEALLDGMAKRYPNAEIVLTGGKHGAWYRKAGQTWHHGIYRVPVVDTTAAGDTFCGYFVAGRVAGLAPETLMEQASIASSIAVSRAGAAPSIPALQEVRDSTLKLQ